MKWFKEEEVVVDERELGLLLLLVELKEEDMRLYLSVSEELLDRRMWDLGIVVGDVRKWMDGIWLAWRREMVMS